LAMEYVGCGDLSQYIADREKAIAGAKTITRQILEGLSILHGEGICHRDLKPQNILVASRIPLRIKIADFGTSKRAENTVLRTKLGTPAYSAPELMGSSMTEFTNALDIWSLGILVHEVLTSKRPFFDQAAFGDDSEDISGLAPEAIRFVRGLLAARPEDRPTASAALRDVWLYI
ncbi:kinase-like protein, partial [Morchella conica CCBAS932]